MDCADHCICGDGDTDGAGSNLLYVGVLDKEKRAVRPAFFATKRNICFLAKVSLSTLEIVVVLDIECRGTHVASLVASLQPALTLLARAVGERLWGGSALCLLL